MLLTHTRVHAHTHAHAHRVSWRGVLTGALLQNVSQLSILLKSFKRFVWLHRWWFPGQPLCIINSLNESQQNICVNKTKCLDN